ncbi:MAG: ATP-binding protein [Oscillospiraceae bacterium]|nr:ATP-binding protein [Oscillospiraceae bacterium]
MPLSPAIARLPMAAYGILSVVYWLTFTAAIGVMVCRCYEIPLGNALFRILLGCVLESIPTTFIRYLVVMMWLPELPGSAPASYILLTFAVYGFLYWSAYAVVARPLQQGGTVVKDDPRSLWSYGVILLAFLLIMYSTNGICEWVIPSVGDSLMGSMQGQLMRYFCVGIRFLVSTAFFVSQYYVYQTSFLQYERELTSQLLREKSEQYEFTKENIEFIQRKCHDLKRQLRALELAGDEERKAVLEETRRAAEFYDATIRTGHEVIDTLLTEKNLLCVNRNIRLSCAVSVRGVDRIGTVDLYTMLSNALDNAIESAERLEEPGMKTIRFSMFQQGEMLCIEVENYYAGTVKLRDGLPVTSKKDAANHGIGVKSIRTLAQRYGGGIAISTENQTFLLQIVIPLFNH